MRGHGALAGKLWEMGGWGGTLLWMALAPVSILYSAGVRVRNCLYSAELLPSKRLPCAVVSVGNLTVGGTGKTPTVIWLAGELGKLGYQVAILSRGYRRRRVRFVKTIRRDREEPAQDIRDPRAAGDEPAMMARMFGQRVGVGKNRYETAGHFLRDGKVDVFILDDGFQHRRLKRDLDLVLLGADWDGWLIPAGPFREPRSELRRAGVFVITGARDRWEPLIERYRKQGVVFYGSLQPRALMSLEGDQLIEHPLGLLTGRKIIAVSAIANPSPFYRMIHDCEGEIVDAIEFPDHYEYSTEDWRRINHAARRGDFILTTEKDLVKLILFPFARQGLYALRVSMEVQAEDSLVRMIHEAIQRKVVGPSAPSRKGTP